MSWRPLGYRLEYRARTRNFQVSEDKLTMSTRALIFLAKLFATTAPNLLPDCSPAWAPYNYISLLLITIHRSRINEDVWSAHFDVTSDYALLIGQEKEPILLPLAQPDSRKILYKNNYFSSEKIFPCATAKACKNCARATLSNQHSFISKTKSDVNAHGDEKS